MRTYGRKLAISGALVAGATAVISAAAVSASGHSAPAAVQAPAMDGHGWRIANAMSAAPRSVSGDARIMDFPEDGGDLVQLRAGKNGWTCLADDPNTPGNDPICFDEQTAGWVDAWLSHKTPKLAAPGFAYMLRGASDASNTDPYATKPAKGERWMSSPPHVMVFPSGKLAKGTYKTDPDNGGPWVMYAGTPYEHFMVPVASAHGGMHGMAMGGEGGSGGGSQTAP